MGKVTYTVFDGEIVEEDRDGTIRDYVPDSLGSTRALLDSSQTQTDTWDYWPYGEVESRTGSSVTPFTFVGTLGYYSGGAGGTYVRARYYRPSTGQWTTKDRLWPSQPSYRYAGGNPAQFSDPSGNAISLLVFGIIALGGFLLSGCSKEEKPPSGGRPVTPPAPWPAFPPLPCDRTNKGCDKMCRMIADGQHDAPGWMGKCYACCLHHYGPPVHPDTLNTCLLNCVAFGDSGGRGYPGGCFCLGTVFHRSMQAEFRSV